MFDPNLISGIIRVRGEPSERLIPSLGVEMGLGGSKFFFIIIIISFAGPRAGPLYFDTQAPRQPRLTRKITPRLEVLLVKHEDLAVARGCCAAMETVVLARCCPAAMLSNVVAAGWLAATGQFVVARGC